MKKLLLLFFAISLSISAMAQLVGGTTYPINGTESAPTSFASLRSAIAYLQANGVTGSGQVILEFTAPYDATVVDAPAAGATKIVIPNITGTSASLGVTIRPATGFTTALSANVDAAGLLELDGAKYITIDGRQGGTGTIIGLTIENLSTTPTAGTATICLINDAAYNKITFSNLNSASANTGNTAGTIYFIGSTGSIGNSNNIISNNNFSVATGGTRANAHIVNNNPTGVLNATNQILDNNLQRFTFRSISLISNGLGDGWTINGNSIFSPISVTGAPSRGIFVGGGNGHTISGNYVGGTAPMCGGSKLQANYFYAIDVSFGLGATSTVQNNTIANITSTFSTAVTASTTFYHLINVAGGNVDIINNTLGSTTDADNITLTTTTTAAFNLFANGIFVGGLGNVNVTGNKFGGLTYTSTAAAASNNNLYVRLIYIAATNLASLTVDGNVIGNTLTDNIKSVTGSRVTYLQPIFTTNSGSFTNNTIRNIASVSAGGISGIYVSEGTTGRAFNISNNAISNFSNTVANGAVRGIYFNISADNITTTANIDNNVIDNLSNNVNANVAGITATYSAGTTAALFLNGSIAGNRISNLSSSGTGTASIVYGISGGCPSNNGFEIRNNHVSNLSTSGTSLTNSSSSVLYGINQSFSGNAISFKDNTVADLTCTGTAVTHVIGIASFGGRQISGNRVYNLYNTNATVGATVKGIVLRQNGTFNAYNNIISLTGVNNDVAVYGFETNATTPGTAANIYHNTVHIDGAIPSGSSVSAGIFTGTTTPINVNNNILSVSRGGGGGTHVSINNAGGASATTNYNLYIYPSATTSDANSQAFNYGDAGKPASSVVFFANSSSPNYMSVVAAYDSFFKNLGTPLAAVPNDIKNNARSATTPSLGAYEANTETLLPVNIKTFTAKLNNNKVALNWTVGTEANVNRYEVERSSNGVDFVKVAQVTANGSSSYNAVDANPVSGINYYRLKGVDNDGTLSLFNELRSVKIESLNAKVASVYPNPLVGNTINISLANYTKGIYIYKLVDVTGKTVQQGNFVNNGSESSLISVNTVLTKGIYMLQVINGAETIQSKIIKQ